MDAFKAHCIYSNRDHLEVEDHWEFDAVTLYQVCAADTPHEENTSVVLSRYDMEALIDHLQQVVQEFAALDVMYDEALESAHQRDLDDFDYVEANQ